MYTCVHVLWRYWELNPRPTACEAGVLPLNYIPINTDRIENVSKFDVYIGNLCVLDKARSTSFWYNTQHNNL
jgi:hypothetical protein